jgi:hypothetical protein
MEDVDFSSEFCSFIKTTIPSVDAAELLLLFHSKPDSALTLDEAAGKLGPGITTSDIADRLESYVGAGLLSMEGDRYRYRSATPKAGDVDRLAQAYQQRPVTLVRIIYALRDSKIQSFADAFKLRRS